MPYSLIVSNNLQMSKRILSIFTINKLKHTHKSLFLIQVLVAQVFVNGSAFNDFLTKLFS